MRFMVSFLMLLSLSVSSYAGEATDRLNKFTASLQSMRAKFKQTLFDDKMQQVETSNGEVFLQKPGKFRWSYKKPYEQEIVADGKKLWLHDIDLEQVTVKTIDAALGQAPIALLTGSKPITEEFNVVELGKMSGRYLLQLESKTKDTNYGLILLGLGETRLEVMELKDRLGNVTRIEFIDAKINAKLDQNKFKFVPPKGIDIIGR